MLLQHMLLSHHGQYEFGSPKRPKTLEATVLNYLDDLDSKINGIKTHIGREPDNHSRWTTYHRLYDRYFYKGELPCEEGDNPALAPELEEKAAPLPVPKKEDKEQKGFHNNPFEDLKEKNLDLF
jgi:3'-5' exoribonuclease